MPPEHLARGVATATRNPDGSLFDYRNVLGGLFQVCSASGHHPPEDAYVAVRYRDHWYWYYIDDRDQATKAAFTLITELARLDLGPAGPGQTAPLLTLPVGR